MSCTFLISLIVAIGVIFGPAYLGAPSPPRFFYLKCPSARALSHSPSLTLPLPLAADPSDAARLGYYGEDYEGNLCGQTTIHADGSRGRDLRSRPYAYWMNSSAAVCVRRCPRLADELACEYPFEAVPIAQQRQQLGSRCFSQIRTRPSFPACLPHQPAAAAAVDRWLSAHAVDQLAADTLQASAVILGCWTAARRC